MFWHTDAVVSTGLARRLNFGVPPLSCHGLGQRGACQFPAFPNGKRAIQESERIRRTVAMKSNRPFTVPWSDE
ncbi:MAG: hypothetical protein ACOCVA_00825 [Prolixibacteraceae bacterium]